MLNYRVLILNQNYEPLTICKVKRAINLLLLGKADLLENHNGEKVCSVSISLPVPSVLRLKYYINIKRKDIALTKKNIIKRDNRQCQYCGTTTGIMTTDHVIPKSLGGVESWENLVCACVTCNNRKGGRPLEEARIMLLKRPRKPHYFAFVISALGKPDERWRPYLFLH